jgi:hypothetical protein
MKLEIPTKPLVLLSVTVLVYTLHIVIMDWLKYLN